MSEEQVRCVNFERERARALTLDHMYQYGDGQLASHEWAVELLYGKAVRESEQGRPRKKRKR